MDKVDTDGDTSTYKNIMVHGAIFAEGDVVAKVHTHINASTEVRTPNAYDVVLNTKSTKASFMAIVTAYPVYAGNAGVPEREPARYWINDHDTCKFSVGGIAFATMEVQAVFK